MEFHRWELFGPSLPYLRSVLCSFNQYFSIDLTRLSTLVHLLDDYACTYAHRNVSYELDTL